MESFVIILLSIFGVYLALGVLFSIIYLWKGISKVDSKTEESGFFFKILLFPGMCFFWILFLMKWMKSSNA